MRWPSWDQAIASYRDEAVVLRKLDYGEADRVYTLLTRQHGKVGAIAKGVRRPASKLAAALELYSLLDVMLARGRNLDVVTQAVRLPGPRLRAEVERTAHAALVAELADRVSEERHPLEGLYELTSTALRELALEPEPRRASAWFMAQALELLGYSPRLRSCAACERPLPPDAAAAFSAPAGGCLGEECAEPGQHVLPSAAVKVLRLMVAGDLDLYRRLRLEGPLLGEVEWALEAQLEHHLDRRLKSLRFLRQLYPPPATSAPFQV